MSARPESLRAFLALVPDAAARAEAARVAELLRRDGRSSALRWVAPESYHVTLHFLGSLERARLPLLAEHLAAELAGEAPFALGLERVGAFPTTRRARVVVLELGPVAPAARLAATCGRAPERLGIELEERAFRPHLTLARARRGQRPPALVELPTVAPLSFPVCDVVLFESQLAPGGSRYTPVERWSLAGRQPDASTESPRHTWPDSVPAQED